MITSGRLWGAIATILLAAAFTTAAPAATAQPETPTTLSRLLAQVEARGNTTPALIAVKEWLARHGDVGLPMTKANRAIEHPDWKPGCVQPVGGFEINAQRDGPDVAAMIYHAPAVWSWEPTPDPPGVTSPFSGVRFFFINIEQSFIGEIPWEWTGTRTIALNPFERALHINYPIRFSQLTEVGGGTVVAIFIGPDTPTNGPGCIYSQAVIADGSSTEYCRDIMCPSGYPYNRYPHPYG